jgi:hypothetical protein
MTGTTSDPEWDQIVRFWADAYVLSIDPCSDPGRPYAARRRGAADESLRAATPAGLLDAIKDDAAARLSAGGTA